MSGQQSTPGSAEPAAGPLSAISSIKVKLGVLVAATICVVMGLTALSVIFGVPALLAVPVTLAIAVGVTQLLAVGMTSPLRQMTQAARQMAAGDYSGRVMTAARDEVGELAAAFNQMAEELATVDQERRDLVANVSHEVRTPLAALSARLENLVDGVEAVDEAALEQLLGQVRRISALVGDLLDLSRLDAGKSALRLQPLSVAEFLRTSVADLELPHRGVRFEVDVPADLTVTADPHRLTQLVTNLVTNAARHSPSGGVVRVTGRATDSDSWTIEVADDGPGVAAEERERVFERFGTGAGNVGGGTGLGLAIARWVCNLHGGAISFIDPEPGTLGARVRAVLPREPRPLLPGALPSRPATVAVAAPKAVATPSVLPDLFGEFWPQRGVRGRRDLLLLSLVVGLLAAATIPFRPPGLALFLVLIAAGGVLVFASPHRREPFTLACALLSTILASTVLLRDAVWISILCVLAGALVMTAGLTRGRTVAGFVIGAISWPLSALRGLPWLGDSLRLLTGRERTAAYIRTALWSGLAVVVFGLLFASADPLLAAWVKALLPDWRMDNLILRGFIFVAFGGSLLGACYLALNPPRVDPPTGERRPVAHRYEWLLPVALVIAVFALFLVAQATAVFGGHAYLRRTTGLTYAQYVHQGFGQMTFATALTLLVVWAAARKAAVTTTVDRLWLRGSLGLLCALTLVVVASALYRMSLYQEAYGFSRLRLLVDVFESWLGLVVAGVVAAGVRLRGTWLPRFALLTGAAALAGLALINPDAWIARHNIERFENTERIDWWYLQSLSADATPTVLELTKEQGQCLVNDGSHAASDPFAWNLGRWLAQRAVAEAELPPGRSCEVMYGGD